MARSKNYKTLADVSDYSLFHLKLLYNKLPKLVRKAYPTLSQNNILRNCALFSCAYLTGGRISEVLSVKFKNVRKDGEWLILRLPNKKNIKTTWKDAIINIEVEKPFMKHFVKYYIMKLSTGADLDDYMFTTHKSKNKRMQRSTAYRIFCKTLKANPHFFRKLRASHLLEHFNFDAKMLQQYMGWATIISSEPYLKVSTIGIKRKYMLNADELKKILN
jgi:integrase